MNTFSLKYISLFLLAILLSVIAVPSFAQVMVTPNTSKLIVVEDKGGVSTIPYYVDLGLMKDPSVQVPVKPSVQPFLRQRSGTPVSIEAMLPVRSELLSPGRVEPRTIQAPHMSPLFIIGDDDLSKRWLIERGEALKNMGAMGLIVNVQNLQGLKALQALVPTLELSPVSGDDIAIRLNLKHYPVLITSTRIEQ